MHYLKPHTPQRRNLMTRLDIAPPQGRAAIGELHLRK
jgi:hypothetical protein